ncbi:hypothetical protein PABG_12455 [Paracoccidioides brasiliensis Pb03]|nr:hypothetical protein PABG_12455 [Paracoccidioides brasiliensis Pb03]
MHGFVLLHGLDGFDGFDAVMLLFGMNDRGVREGFSPNQGQLSMELMVVPTMEDSKYGTTLPPRVGTETVDAWRIPDRSLRAMWVR